MPLLNLGFFQRNSRGPAETSSEEPGPDGLSAESEDLEGGDGTDEEDAESPNGDTPVALRRLASMLDSGTSVGPAVARLTSMLDSGTSVGTAVAEPEGPEPESVSEHSAEPDTDPGTEAVASSPGSTVLTTEGTDSQSSVFAPPQPQQPTVFLPAEAGKGEDVGSVNLELEQLRAEAEAAKTAFSTLQQELNDRVAEARRAEDEARAVPHPVSWTHVCATRHGVARIARALRLACDTPAFRGASTGCSVRRTQQRPRAHRRGFERPGRRRLAP